MKTSKIRKLVWGETDQLEREWEEERRESQAANGKREDIYSGGGGVVCILYLHLYICELHEI